MRDFQNDLNFAYQLHNTGQIAQAIEIYSALLRIEPKNAYVLLLAGTAYCQLGKHLEGLPFMQNASLAEPNNPFILYNLGRVLADLNRFRESRSAFEKAITTQPDFAEAYSNLGNVLSDLKLLDEALSCHQKALALNPNQPEFHNNFGSTLKHLGKFEDSLIAFESAIAINPEYAEAWSNRGAVFQELKMFDEALASCDRAIAINPEYAEAWSNRGAVFQELKMFDEALASCDRAMAIDHDVDFLRGARLHAQMHTCNWTDFNSRLDNLVDEVGKGAKASTPFSLIALIDSPEIHKIASEIHIKNKFSTLGNSPEFSAPNIHSKIKVGYFSADFHDHATMHLMAELFEKHDKDRFEFVAFSFGPVTNDPWQLRAKNTFDKFIECHGQSDAEVAATSRNLGIDIAVDLKGFTQDSRTGIFAARAAPIQVNFIGYPGTMGANYIDYLIGDQTLIPEQSRDFYTEKIAYLPNCYQPNCRSREISSKPISRSDFGLPESGVVFSSFNNNYKITPEVFASWVRILKAVEGSVLWLLASNSTAEDNLKKHSLKGGIDPDRIVFAQRLPIEEHLNRIRLADLMLDAFPYGAHTTCSDALRMGLPVVTLQGDSFASRVAASLLRTVGLPELAADSHTSYENLAIELANNPEKLARIRVRLTDGIKSSPLFDPDLFARNLESLYSTMYQRHQEGLTLDHIFVSR